MKKAFFVAKVFNFIHQFDDLPMICKKKIGNAINLPEKFSSEIDQFPTIIEVARDLSFLGCLSR
jgi:hypothetical protein